MTMGWNNQNQGRRMGCSPRLLIAVFILIAGAASYYFGTQRNPITGEVQRVKLTPDQEVQLGLQSAPEMASEMGGELPPTDPREQEAKTIGSHLVQTIPNNPYQFDFHVLRDPQTINALLCPADRCLSPRASTIS